MTLFFQYQEIISIHASHAGRDEIKLDNLTASPIFQSTRPMRDATIYDAVKDYVIKFQSTRPMRDATLISE